MYLNMANNCLNPSKEENAKTKVDLFLLKPWRSMIQKSTFST